MLRVMVIAARTIRRGTNDHCLDEGCRETRSRSAGPGRMLSMSLSDRSRYASHLYGREHHRAPPITVGATGGACILRTAWLSIAAVLKPAAEGNLARGCESLLRRSVG